uniref:Uncharacterized protein n=1 Tax=Euplotes crassus TaxID=5936 RepID=A0A7S3KE54_EUPCR|mmetsp:Transcript_18479/g.18167  ORF Transcript_18479/g.18167 Transcript_18479/m.18167 type:complete len:101 (+) Transcript_18479:350-652(+)
MMTKMGKDMMVRKKKENLKYAETVREKEMFEWRNRRRLIATAKATQYRHGAWVPNMKPQEEFDHKTVDRVHYRKRTLGKINDQPLQQNKFKVGIPHRYVG